MKRMVADIHGGVPADWLGSREAETHLGVGRGEASGIVACVKVLGFRFFRRSDVEAAKRAWPRRIRPSRRDNAPAIRRILGR